MLLEQLLRARHTLRGELDAADALHLESLEHRRAGRLDAAENALRRAIERDASVAAYHHDLGNLLQDRGKIDAAIACYRKALRLHPAFAEAWNDLGTARYSKGELEAALECYRQAVRLRPDHMVAHANLGGVCRKLGLLHEARRALQREFFLRVKSALFRPRSNPAQVALDSGHPRLALALSSDPRITALAYLRLGERSKAAESARGDPYITALAQPTKESLERALSKTPRDPALHLALGRVLGKDGEAAYRRALELDPLSVLARVRLSELLRETERLDESQAMARAALELDDESPAAHYALGMVWKARGISRKARESFERSLELEPRSLAALEQLVHLLREEERMDEAERRLRAALRERPDAPQLLADLGLILGDQMRYDEAIGLFDRAPNYLPAINRKALLLDQIGDRARSRELLERALALAPDDPNVHYNLGLHHLKHGDFARGWPLYERRRGFDSFIGRYRRFPLPEWDGGSAEGRTVLVLPEQGLGDEIMFGSCIPDLAARAKHVIVECDAKLEAIFRRSFPGTTVVSRARTVENDWINRIEPKPDLQTSSGSLARVFRKNKEDFPQRPFLKADPGSTAWRAKLEALGPGRKIGLSWKGGVGITGKKRRSFSLSDLAQVLRIPNVHWVNLQYTDVREELKTSPVRVHHWQDAIDDYDQTAALVSALDGVLTVCTAIVHLTGGLGRPALVMVPFGADWRYGASGERMIWYPSVRLIRQSAVARWSDVLDEVSRRIASNTFS